MGPYLGAQLLAILGQPAQLLVALLEMGSLGLHQTQHLGRPRWADGRAEEGPLTLSLFCPALHQQDPPHLSLATTTTHKLHDVKLPLVLNHIDLRAQKYLRSVLKT